MDYESGKAIPNNQVMGKIERALGECFIFNLHECTLLKKLLLCHLSITTINYKSMEKLWKELFSKSFFVLTWSNCKLT